MASDNRILQSSSKSVYYSIAVQLLFRTSSFLMNIILLRFISKDILGLVNIRLMLLFNTIYCLSTEPLVRTCLSRNKDTKLIPPSTINTLWLSVPIGLVWSVVSVVVWLVCFDWPDESITEFYWSAVVCYGLSAFIEVLSEPLRILTQILLIIKVKPFIEGLSLAVETLVLVTCVVLWPAIGLQAFCIARLVHSSCVTLSYYTYVTYRLKKNNERKKNDVPEINEKDQTENEFPFNSFHQMLPTFSKPTNNPQNPTLQLPINSSLLWTFSKQVILKQMITEGEKYIMTIFGLLSFKDQGLYSIVSNLGSMVVRIVMLPMEEGFYLFVSRTIPRGYDARKMEDEEEFKDSNESTKNNIIEVKYRKEMGKDIDNSRKDNLHTAAQPQNGSLSIIAETLECMLKLRFLLGLTLAIFGFSSSFMVLDILFGPRISAHPGPVLLQWVSLYMLFVSLNGVLEAFLNASMSTLQVDVYNKYMLFFSAFFLFVCLFLTSILPSIIPSIFIFFLPSPPTAFIISNCLNMLLRIVYSSHYIHQYFKGTCFRPLRGFKLSLSVIGAFLTAFVLIAVSEAFFITNNDQVYINGKVIFHAKALAYSCHGVVVLLSLVLVAVAVYCKEVLMAKFLRDNYVKKE